MIRMGIDASTKCTGYCIFKDNKLLSYDKIKIEDSTMDWRDRVIWMTKHLSKIAQEEKVEEICVEVPIKTSRNVKTLELLFSLHGALIGMAEALHIHMIPVEVSQWRKQLHLLTGIPKGEDNRAILKQRSIELANELYDLNLVWKSPSSKFNDDDISDSILICHTIIHKDDRGFGQST